MAVAVTTTMMEPREDIYIILITVLLCLIIFVFQTLLVAGGYGSGSVWLSSTELLMGEASAWVNTGELPSPRIALRGANIDNRVLMTGN